MADSQKGLMPQDRYIDVLLKDSKLLQNGYPAVYNVSLKQTFSDDRNQIRKYEVGRPPHVVTDNTKVILIVGATGAGKTTLINGMINYMLNVNWDDAIRFKAIIEEGEQTEQANSMTKWISAYTVHKQHDSPSPYSLTVIDTPGFGDTGGISRDDEITSQLRKLFLSEGSTGIDHVDAVGIVVPSSQPRLTQSQKYVFNCVLSVFGNDIAENIFLLVTFADPYPPPVLSAVKALGLSFTGYFKFNNGALYMATMSDDGEPDTFASQLWQTGITSMRGFFAKLSTIRAKSLFLTKDVLGEREVLDAMVRRMQPKIQAGLTKMDEISQLKKQYNLTSGQKAEQQKLILSTQDEFKRIADYVFALIQSMQQSLARLHEIALRPNPLSTTDYIDLLIQTETSECKSGFLQRIHHLKEARKKAEIYGKIGNRDTKYIDLVIAEMKSEKDAGYLEAIECLQNIKKQGLPCTKMCNDDKVQVHQVIAPIESRSNTDRWKNRDDASRENPRNEVQLPENDISVPIAQPVQMIEEQKDLPVRAYGIEPRIESSLTEKLSTKHGDMNNSGNSTFSQFNVWLDNQNHLHLKIDKLPNGNGWTSAGVCTIPFFSFGTFQWFVSGRLDKLPENVRFDLGLWNGKWFKKDSLIYVSSRGDSSVLTCVGARGEPFVEQSSPVRLPSDSATFRIIWTKDSVTFQILRGHTNELYQESHGKESNRPFRHQIEKGRPDIPSTDMRVYMSLNFLGRLLANNDAFEIVVHDFKYFKTC